MKWPVSYFAYCKRHRCGWAGSPVKPGYTIALAFPTALLLVLLLVQPLRAETASGEQPVTFDSFGLSRLVAHTGSDAASRSVTPQLLQVGNETPVYAVDLYGDGLLWFSLDRTSVMRMTDQEGHINAVPLMTVSRMLSDINTGPYTPAAAISSAQGTIEIVAASITGEPVQEPASSTATALHVDDRNFPPDQKRNTRRLKGQVLTAKISSMMKIHTEDTRPREMGVKLRPLNPKTSMPSSGPGMPAFSPRAPR